MLYTLGSMGFSLEQIERGAHSAARDVACLVDLQRCKDENPHAVHQHTSICYARGDWLTLEGEKDFSISVYKGLGGNGYFAAPFRRKSLVISHSPSTAPLVRGIDLRTHIDRVSRNCWQESALYP